MTITSHEAQSYAAQVAALLLIGTHRDSIESLLTTHGAEMPEPMEAALRDQLQTSDRVLKTIEAVDV